SAVTLGLRMTGRLEGLLTGNEPRRARLISLIVADRHLTAGECGFGETLDSIRDEMRRFADTEIMPQAQAWHRSNSSIPLGVVSQLAELRVFGLTAPEAVGA